MIVCVVISSALCGRPYGVVMIDKKYPTCYDVMDGVTAWLEEHMSAKDITFKQGYYGKDSSEVTCTLGGAAPYTATFKNTSIENCTRIT
jgi:hypothetical protein